MFKKIYKFLTCFVVVGAVILQCGCTNALNFRHEYDKGMRAYNEQDYDTAIVNFSNALNYKPDSYSALCLLGTSYAYKKDVKMAEKTFQDAIKLFPDEWNAYVLLGDLKRNRRDFSSAIDLYETAVSLESMGGKEKSYYKKLVKEIKNEQTSFMAKNMLEEPNEMNAASVFKAKSAKPLNEKGEIVLGIDLKKAEKIYDQKDEKSRLLSYLLKDGDVQKIVTSQYFVFNSDFKPKLTDYYNDQMKKLENLASTSNKTFEKKIIKQSKDEILYEWKFDGGKESEIARIILGSKGIYHIHCAKEGPFTNDDKVKFLDLLKTVKLK